MQRKQSLMGATKRAIVLHPVCFGALLFAFDAKLAINKASADLSVTADRSDLAGN